ncbi:bifunctional 3-(3-hydroxy-phenyl)propionate/3-hydroxycinnamic acid hydroxylase [Paraburkholderia bannensis]|uniref:bifunctional 3-(3-hydroxy-phenyl)propionate/3-hydroxycinnamic acid hydroxylase n=1 Tax=Paraburkholderia bannensis TaxID=765414 RepID=UPI002ABE8A47|nr:bifunctional 3-(3-hydroxy-phenyl)propionate/3-hydroxycinnamic acid hydroxylase [Paraburkholderia bannensis]
MDFDADVAIVGYGPVGQALAAALLGRGHSVLVLERWPALYALPRAVVYDHEVARILQSIGIADQMQPHTALSSRYEWRNGRGDVLKAFDGLDRNGVSGWPERLSFSQPSLEETLDARVRSFGDRVQILQGHQVSALVEGNDGVSLTAVATDVTTGAAIDAPASEARHFRTRYVVGCDGAGSFVREAMGARYDDLGFSADWLVVDVLPNHPADWTNELIQLCDPVRPTTSVSGGPGRRRLEFMLLSGETKEAMNNAATAWRLLEAHGWNPSNARLERHAVYTFRGCVAAQWRNGRVMIAGDAAHLTPPFAGQGLCAGMRDVAALAWRLDLILRGLAQPQLLNSYGLERTTHVRRFIDFAIELGKVICELDPQAAAGRDAWLLGPGANAEDRFPPLTLPPSDCLRARDPLAGELSVQGRVRMGDTTGRFDDIAGGGFTLIGWEHDPLADLSVSQRSWLERVGVKVVAVGAQQAVADIDGTYAAWFAQMGCRAVLVRPDFYVFGAGEALELVRDLQRTLYWGTPDDSTPASATLVQGYFAARLHARVSPAVLRGWMAAARQDVAVVDVRNPRPELNARVEGALVAAAGDASALASLPRDKTLVLYSWDDACTLLPAVALKLLGDGLAVKELAGGFRGWQEMRFPVVDAARDPATTSQASC